MVIGFASDMCEKGLSDMVKYLLTKNTPCLRQGGIMKGKHPQKRVNPIPMITIITEIFNPVLTKPTLKNVILTTLAIALAKTFRINEIASRLPVGGQASKDETETAPSILSPSLSTRCSDGVLVGFRAEARLSTRHRSSLDFD